jgi:hypothetical protein
MCTVRKSVAACSQNMATLSKQTQHVLNQSRVEYKQVVVCTTSLLFAFGQDTVVGHILLCGIFYLYLILPLFQSIHLVLVSLCSEKEKLCLVTTPLLLP